MPFSLLFAFFFTFCLFFVENLKSIGKKKGRGGVYLKKIENFQDGLLKQDNINIEEYRSKISQSFFLFKFSPRQLKGRVKGMRIQPPAALLISSNLLQFGLGVFCACSIIFRSPYSWALLSLCSAEFITVRVPLIKFKWYP